MEYILFHHCLSGNADWFLQITIMDTEGIVQCINEKYFNITDLLLALEEYQYETLQTCS